MSLLSEAGLVFSFQPEHHWMRAAGVGMKLTRKYSVSCLAKHLLFSPCFTGSVFILLEKIILKLLIVLG